MNRKSDVPYSKDDYVNCVDAFTSTLVILGGIVSQVSGQDIIEDSILLFSNIVGFCIACAFLHSEYKKKIRNKLMRNLTKKLVI